MREAHPFIIDESGRAREEKELLSRLLQAIPLISGIML
jgi:hypothetical protein